MICFMLKNVNFRLHISYRNALFFFFFSKRQCSLNSVLIRSIYGKLSVHLHLHKTEVKNSSEMEMCISLMAELS